MTQLPPPLPPPAPPLPPLGDRAAVAAARQRQSFGEQAARFSLYVPLVVILIAFLTRRSAEEAGLQKAVGWLNLSLMVAGFLLGIAALISMRVYGRQGILGRAVIGVVVNALLLLAAASFLLPVFAAQRLRAQVVGHWELESRAGRVAAPLKIDIHFAGDGTFRMTMPDATGRRVASASGSWRVDRRRTIGLVVEGIEVGDPFDVGETIALGIIKSVDADRMVLKTAQGEDVLRRLP